MYPAKAPTPPNSGIGARMTRVRPDPFGAGCGAALLLALLLAAPLAQAATPPTEPAAAFADANRLYEQGRFPEAAAAYQSLLDQHTRSAGVLFNLGNARFRAGQLGQAIFHYRLALQLSPRDPDIRANLQFARNAVAEGSVVPSRFQQTLARFTPDEWAASAIGAFWVTAGLLIAASLRPALRRPLRHLLLLGGLATLLTFLAAGWLWHQQHRQSTAIVIVPDASVRFGPLEESRRRYVARDGTELTVLDRQGDWIQVANRARDAGWIEASAVRIFPPPEPTVGPANP